MKHRAVFVVLLSAVVRLLAYLFAESGADLRLVYDERGYFEQATGFHRAGSAWLRGEGPPSSALDLAYRGGIWPPFHPIVLAIGMFLLGESTAAARFVVLLLSIATTWAIHRLGLRIGGPGAATGAALLHAVYPGFVAFSHYLWSETTFILLLVLAALALLRSLAAGEDRAGGLAAAATGLAIGLACLTRAAALPLLGLAPFALLALGRSAWRPRVGRAILMLVTQAAIVTPWLVTLEHREGSFQPLSTAGGFNLLLGNSEPSVGEPLRSRLRKEAGVQGVHPSQLAQRLAWEEIRSRPGLFVRRTLDRARQFPRPDDFIARHFLSATYRPIPLWTMALVLIGLQLAILSVTGLAVAGAPTIWRSEPRALLVLGILAAGVALAPLLTVSNTRMALPLVALGLPLCGVAIDRLRHRQLPRAALVAGLAAAAIAAANAWIPLAGIPQDWQTSGRYASVVRRLAPVSSGPLQTADCLRLHRRSEAAGLPSPRLSAAQSYRLEGMEPRRLDDWWQNPSSRPLAARVVGDGATAAPELLFAAVAGAGSADILVRPTERRFWREPAASGVPGLDLTWCGGVPPVDREP